MSITIEYNHQIPKDIKKIIIYEIILKFKVNPAQIETSMYFIVSIL